METVKWYTLKIWINEILTEVKSVSTFSVLIRLSVFEISQMIILEATAFLYK